MFAVWELNSICVHIRGTNPKCLLSVVFDLPEAEFKHPRRILSTLTKWVTLVRDPCSNTLEITLFSFPSSRLKLIGSFASGTLGLCPH